MGRPRSSILAPLLRSDALARTLSTIMLSDESLHLRAIADRTGLPYSVVQREVDRLEEAGVVSSTRFHTARVVRPREDHPVFAELRALLLKAFGPREVVASVLHGIEAIDEAFLYGSWAARYEGVWGPPHADVDVLVVGRPPIARIQEAEAEAEDALGQPVQIVVVPQDEWKAARDGFVRTVKERPLVSVRLDASP